MRKYYQLATGRMVKFLGGERKFGKPSDRKKDSELKVVIEVYLQDSEGKKGDDLEKVILKTLQNLILALKG